MPFLKVFTNNEERTVFLGDDPIVFGRGDDVDVLLKDVKVSREHCVIEKDAEGRWRVLDLQSGNGTRVNGETVRSRLLDPEDVVEVGDAKVLFAAEAAAVVTSSPPPPPAAKPPPESTTEQSFRPARAARAGQSSRGPFVVGGILLAGLFVIGLWWQSRGNDQTSTATTEERRATAVTERDEPPSGRTAAEFLASLPSDLDVYQRVVELEKLLKQALPIDRPGCAEALGKARDAEHAVRERFFGDLEAIFSRQVRAGEYARAREIWFFLHEDVNWSPIPSLYRDRIIRSNMELENAASAARSRLLNEVARAEDAHDFEHAEKLLKESLGQFRGTSVERSLHERIDEIELARRGGVKTPASKSVTRVRADTRKLLAELVGTLDQRDFALVAAGIARLAEVAGDAKEKIELRRRAAEIQAAADLQAAVVAELVAGKAPRKQIEKRWRIVTGDRKSLTVKTRGNELNYPWAEVPAPLHMALLARKVDSTGNGKLGLAVAAHVIGDKATLLLALATVYADGEKNEDVDRYLAEIVRNEPLPEGGYVVHGGELLTRADFVRQQEEELIAQFKAQLDRSYAAIKADKSLSKLNKLIAKKDELDRRRNYALELIFDEKKYFYPYRHRANEYYPVQKEVDHRVEKVVEAWEDGATVKVSESDAVKRLLKKFDEAASELEKRYVDVEEKVAEIRFLRAYFGKKFTIQTLFRTQEELDLIDYTVEVMEWNTQVKGDIKANEREQVRVTNDYRIMFGRWPVRIVEKLVLSSRGHCEEMSRLGYFGHFSPTPGRKSPYDRMRLAGYQCGSSENIVAGTTDPKSAHQRWCHSSGHHRNLLMPPWTEMGTGALGSFMCQNFGRAPRWRHTPPDQGGGKSDDDDGPSPGMDLEDEGDAQDKENDPYDYDDDDE